MLLLIKSKEMGETYSTPEEGTKNQQILQSFGGEPHLKCDRARLIQQALVNTVTNLLVREDESTSCPGRQQSTSQTLFYG
jgi:hypothetical protein